MKRCLTSVASREMQMKPQRGARSEKPPRTCQSGCGQAMPRAERPGRKGAQPLRGHADRTAAGESTGAPQEVKARATIWPSNPSSGHLPPKFENTDL